jgi:thioredoxin-like negative regulator of GroEL
VLFTLEGCGACAEYKPRFAKLAAPYAGHVPVVYADADDPQYADLANRLNVEAVPVTFVLRRPRGMIRLTGSSTDAQITWLLNAAAQAART